MLRHATAWLITYFVMNIVVQARLSHELSRVSFLASDEILVAEAGILLPGNFSDLQP